MPIFSLLAIGVLWLACAHAALAQGPPPPPGPGPYGYAPGPRVWGGVILATNNPHPGQPPERVRRYAEKLHHIFGYNQFEVVGESSERLDQPDERWLVPTKDFAISIRKNSAPGQHLPTRIALFQHRRRLAEFESHLSPDSPLFIRGPLYDRGQLVIVLHAMEPGELPVRPRVAIPADYSTPRVSGERLKEHGSVTIEPFLPNPPLHPDSRLPQHADHTLPASPELDRGLGAKQK